MEQKGWGEGMKIIVDKRPSTIDECPFFCYRDNMCLAHGGGWYCCSYDEGTTKITKPCDLLIELSEVVGNAIKNVLQD